MGSGEYHVRSNNRPGASRATVDRVADVCDPRPRTCRGRRATHDSRRASLGDRWCYEHKSHGDVQDPQERSHTSIIGRAPRLPAGRVPGRVESAHEPYPKRACGSELLLRQRRGFLRELHPGKVCVDLDLGLHSGELRLDILTLQGVSTGLQALGSALYALRCSVPTHSTLFYHFTARKRPFPDGLGVTHRHTRNPHATARQTCRNAVPETTCR